MKKKKNMRGDSSRMIFIDSNVATHGDRVKITLPSAGFTAGSSDRMSLTLQSFSMKRNFHNIHKFNNTFYIYLPASSQSVEVVRTPGTYSTLTLLAAQIQTNLRAAINAAPTAVTNLIDDTNCTVTVPDDRCFAVFFSNSKVTL